MDGLAQKLAKESGLVTAPAPQSANDYNGLDPREVVDIPFFLKPEELDEAVAIRKGRAEQDISGNVDLSTIGEYARTGLDYNSVGALTKHVHAVDLSLRLQLD